MKVLSNYELIDLANKYNIPLVAIYNKDTIPKLLKDGYYIINLDRSDGTGTHWTCASFRIGKINYYFDSFGFEAPKQLEQLLGRYLYNDKIIQSLNSNSCGWFCLFMIKYCSSNNNNFNYISFLNQFRDNEPNYNEQILENYFKQLNY